VYSRIVDCQLSIGVTSHHAAPSADRSKAQMTDPQLPRVLAPVVTPFFSDLEIDTPRFLEHCDQLVQSGAGLTLFGTNSEANSLSLSERGELLGAVLAHGIPTKLLIVGTGTCSIPETVALTEEAVHAGCPGVLMLPTFFYKNQTTAGVVAYFSEIIERVADGRLRIYLYNIPSLSGVSISTEVVRQLADRYPTAIAGLKESSGDWATTQVLMQEAVERGLDVYVGSERFLLQALAAGGRGCISATANVNARAIVDLADNPERADANDKQRGLAAMRTAFENSGSLISVVKANLALRYGHDGWRRVRPPLQAISR